MKDSEFNIIIEALKKITFDIDSQIINNSHSTHEFDTDCSYYYILFDVDIQTLIVADKGDFFTPPYFSIDLVDSVISNIEIYGHPCCNEDQTVLLNKSQEAQLIEIIKQNISIV